MADNTRLPLGTQDGDTYASDDIAGVKHQRVKLEIGADGAASDVHSGNPLPVSDAAGSLTVDSPQLPAALVGGRLDVNVGAGTLSISGTLDTELPAAAALADAAANPTTPTVGAALLFYNGTTLDRARGDTTNGLDVDVTRSALPTGASTSANQTTEITALQLIDDTVHAINDPLGKANAIAGQLDDTSTTAATENNVAPVRITAQRGMHANLRNNAGTEVGTSGAPLRTDPTGTTTQPVSGTVTNAEALADNAAFTDGTSTVIPSGHIFDETAGTALTENDVAASRIDSKRAQVMVIEDGTTRGTRATVSSGRLLVNAIGTFTSDAHDAPINGNLMAIGGLASAAAPASVSADLDAAQVWVTRFGALNSRLVDDAGDSCMDGANNALRVNLVAGSAAGGTSMTDDAAFTPGTTAVTPVAGTYRVTRDNVDDADAGALAITQKRALLTSPESPLGDSLVDDTSDTLKVSGAVAVDASATNVNPLLMGARASNAAPSAVSADGDAVIPRADRLGQLGVRLYDAAGDSCMDETNNSLNVTIVAGAGSGGTSMTDDAAFTPGTTGITPMGGTYRTSRDNLDDNDGGAVALTQKRAQLACIETPAGDSAMDDVNDAVRVNIVTALGAASTVPISWGDTALTDSITSNGDEVMEPSMNGGRGVASFDLSGTWVATLQFEQTFNLTDWVALPVFPAGGGPSVTNTAANGQWQAQVGAAQRLRIRASAYTSGTAVGKICTSSAGWNPPVQPVTVSTALPAGTNNIGDVDVLTLPGVAGVAASDAPVSGNPVLVAGRASAAAPADVSADGDVVSAWRLRNGAAASVLTAAGALIGGDATNGLDVDVTRVTGTVTTQDTASLVDNAAFTDGTSRVIPVGYAFDETAGTALTENDIAAARIDSKRAQVGTIEDATTRGQRVAVNAGGALEVHGDVAHDAAVGGNPVLNGFEARTTDGTAVASGDAVRGLSDTLGKQVVLVGAIHDLILRGTANYTTTTAADLIAAQGAGVRIAVMAVLVTNASSSVSTKVEIRDGTTVKILGQSQINGGGFNWNSTTPLFISTANTAVTGRCVTTGANVDVTVCGYRIVN